MALFGGSRSNTTQVTNIDDERIAATDGSSVLRAEGGSTINFGLTEGDLGSLLGFAGDALAGQREITAASLAQSGEALSGTAGSRAKFDQFVTLAIIAGVALVAIQAGPSILGSFSA